jgi:hypothetical protein
MILAMARTYTADLPGGTATTTIQMQGKHTLKQAVLTWLNAAAGKIELSTNATSQIGTAQPTSDVVFRCSVSAGANQSQMVIPITLGVAPFQNIYVHQTGAGNLGTIALT